MNLIGRALALRFTQISAKTMNNNPIGIFDSGVGGLTVWKELKENLPNENIIYLADSKNCPYGEKSQDEIIQLSITNTEFLLKQNCKAIVVACNTATAAAIDTLRNQYSIPFIGMEPAIKPAAINTNTGRIGVLATKGTFEGRLFKETSQKFANHVSKIVQIGEGLVELVESGERHSDQAFYLLKKYINPMIDAGVDQIVLGCTHYPFFSSQIKKIIPSYIKLVDPASAIAERTLSVLRELSLESNNNISEYQFYSTGNDNTLKRLLKELTGNDFKTYKI